MGSQYLNDRASPAKCGKHFWAFPLGHKRASSSLSTRHPSHPTLPHSHFPFHHTVLRLLSLSVGPTSTLQLFAVLLTALALVSSTTALPVAVTPAAIRRSEKIVYSPPIKSPSKGTVWKVGSKQIVTWDTSSVPSGAELNIGTILLGFQDNSGSENLDYSEFPPRRTPPPYTIHREGRCFWFRADMSLRRTPPCKWLSADRRATIHHSTEGA